VAATVQLEIQGDSSNFTFDIEGVYLPRLTCEFKAASNPRELVAIREVWEIRGARLVAAASTTQANATDNLWGKFTAFRARIATRGSAYPTYARFVRGSTVLHTIGPSVYEDFQIDEVQGETDPDNPAATWRRSGTFTLVISAVERFATASGVAAGVVGWDQVVDSSFPDGRHRLEWRTRITTKESAATSAVALAQTIAALDVLTLGGTYLYETGDTNGAVDVVVLDADEALGRQGTVVEAVSRVRSFGITIGEVLPGAAPSDVEFSITTSTTADEEFTTTRAEATGPNAAQFVLGMAPAVFNEKLVTIEEAKLRASGVWTNRVKKTKDSKLQIQFQIQVTVSGGGRAIDFEPIADGGVPLEQVGAFLPMVAIVEVEIENIGVSGNAADMKVPGHPGDPWRLDRAASAEGAPFLKELATTADRSTWHRTCRYVYRCASPPTTQIQARLIAAAPVPTLLYPAA
jgi:hypothetical protein